MTPKEALALPLDTPEVAPDEGPKLFAECLHENVMNWHTARNFFDAFMWGEVQVFSNMARDFGYPILANRFVLAWVLLNHEGHFDAETHAYLDAFLEAVDVTWNEVLLQRQKIAWLRESELG